MSDYPPYPNRPSRPPSVVPSSTMAVISLVAGILGLTLFPLIGSIVAVITGPMAKREIAQSNGTLGGANLAQIGTVLGWIGLAFGLVMCCVAAILVVIPFLLTGTAIFAESVYWVLPMLLAAF